MKQRKPEYYFERDKPKKERGFWFALLITGLLALAFMSLFTLLVLIYFNVQGP